jgi:hypothetical protein
MIFVLPWIKSFRCSPCKSKCCKDFQNVVDQYIGDDCICITLHQDFETVCLSRTVLETAYICFLRYKRFTGRAPETLNPRLRITIGNVHINGDKDMYLVALKWKI